MYLFKKFFKEEPDNPNYSSSSLTHMRQNNDGNRKAVPLVNEY
jgi:hypothetical protein